jgi:hypothetical protein
MNSSTLSLYSDSEYDSHAACSDDEFPEALECWSVQDFLDILGVQAR